MSWKLNRVTWIVAALLLAATLIALGCASSSASANNAISTAMFAIRDARVNSAEQYAPAQLKQAELFLATAQKAKGVEAARLAEKATVHAQMASAIASREAARANLAEARRVQEEAGAVRDMTTEAVEERAR
jgi:hypothetical protein